MGSLKSIFAVGLVAAAMAGCSTLDAVTDFGGSRSNFAAGSAMEHQLSGRDRSALSDAFLTAMQSGEAISWRGGKAVGAVEPTGYALANLVAAPNGRIAMVRDDLDLNHMMETELGAYVLRRSGNMRTGPGTDNPVIKELPAGAGVEVVGRVINKPWMLVAIDGAVSGYIYQQLLIKAPGTELELAGGPQRRPVLCREFTQRLELRGERDEWNGAACDDGTGWRVAPPEIDPATQPQNLLEF